MRERIINPAGLCVAAIALASCGIQPGDYVIYRIASADANQSESCYNNGVPDDIADDSSNLRAGGTIIVYRGPEDLYYLDLGTVVLEGTGDGGSYTFNGKTVDVSYTGGGGGGGPGGDDTGDGGGGGGSNTTLTATDTTTVTMTVERGLVTGSTKAVADRACEGQNCQPNDTSTCTTTTNFVGAEVEDIELNYDVR